MKQSITPFTILNQTINRIKEHPVVFYPPVIIIFLSLFILEILYFIPRFPVKNILGPIISNVWGEAYLHYPNDILNLPKIFYYAQMSQFIFITSFLLGLIPALMNGINTHQHVRFSTIIKKHLKQYIPVFLTAILSIVFYQVLCLFYDLIVQRAYHIQSTSGKFFLLKKMVLLSVPYVHTFFSVCTIFLFAFCNSAIMIKNTTFLGGLKENFKVLRSYAFLTFGIIFIPTMFYVPILILRQNNAFMLGTTIPEFQLLIIVISIITSTIINSLITASCASLYLWQREKVG